MISFRINKTDEWDGEVFYKAHCACGHDDCNIVLDLEYDDLGKEDEDFREVNLNLYNDVFYDSRYGTNNWFTQMFHRIIVALRVLFIGRIKMSSDFMFRGERHIQEFINALEEGKEKLKGSRE